MEGHGEPRASDCENGNREHYFQQEEALVFFAAGKFNFQNSKFNEDADSGLASYPISNFQFLLSSLHLQFGIGDGSGERMVGVLCVAIADGHADGDGFGKTVGIEAPYRNEVFLGGYEILRVPSANAEGDV